MGSILQSIKDDFGSRASDSAMERELYSRDLGPVPALLVDPLFNTMPDLIVRPGATEEISAVMKKASAEKVPVTPRAGASTVFFNSVPVKGGIVMDLGLISGVAALDEARMTVSVRAATTWSDLETYLNARGFACKTVPSSAPAATVGGWLCMMGYGIGSLKYGSLLSQVKAIEVVLPDGRVQWLTKSSHPSLEWFASSEGTLGVITEIELEIRRLAPMKHFLLRVPEIHQAVQVMKDLAGARVRPYNMHFSDQFFLRKLEALGYSRMSLPQGFVVAVDYEGPDDELTDADLFIEEYVTEKEFVALLPDTLAEAEWEERFKSIRIKRGGPSVLGGEIWLPVTNLPGYLNDIRRMTARYGVDLLTYGHVETPQHATVMTMFSADETKVLQYIISLSLVKKIQDAGYRNKGCPYGIGLWNTPYLKRIYRPGQIREMRERKRKVDPAGIMNPGKVYKPPFMLNALNFYLGMEFLALVRRVFGRGW